MNLWGLYIDIFMCVCVLNMSKHSEDEVLLYPMSVSRGHSHWDTFWGIPAELGLTVGSALGRIKVAVKDRALSATIPMWAKALLQRVETGERFISYEHRAVLTHQLLPPLGEKVSASPLILVPPQDTITGTKSLAPGRVHPESLI